MQNKLHYHFPENIALTDVDDEMVLLNLDSGTYYGLNRIGAQFVRSIQNGLSRDQTTEEIVRQYQMDRATVNNDIAELIEQLLAQKLMQCTHG